MRYPHPLMVTPPILPRDDLLRPNSPGMAEVVPPWIAEYAPPQEPRIWVGRLVQWFKDPPPNTSVWACFDDLNPSAIRPKTILRAIDNDPVGDTIRARCGADVGWHYLLGVEKGPVGEGLVWSMAFPLQRVVKGLHKDAWVRLLHMGPGLVRARSYGSDGLLKTLWDARVVSLSNAFDPQGVHNVYLTIEGDQGESVIEIPPPLMVDLFIHNKVLNTSPVHAQSQR